jgi:cysteine synthase B
MGVTELIGNTPLVKIDNFSLKKGIEVYAKLEGFNPSGSVKDRIAKSMIEGAEKDGLLKPGMTIVEASSGNTGIGLAMVGRLKRYRVVIVMPSSMSVERRKILASYGAEIVLTPAEDGMDGAIAVTEGIAAKEGYFMPNQFANRYNFMAHYETTGKEIAEKIKPTHLVAGVGTGGTIMGVGKRLKEANSGLKIIGIEPHKNTPIQGLKNMEVSRKPDIFDEDFLDELIYVRLDEAMATARRLAKEESIFAGVSSGAAMHGVLKVAKKLKRGIIVTVFPDSGDKYLSTGLYSKYAVSRRFKSLEAHR